MPYDEGDPVVCDAIVKKKIAGVWTKADPTALSLIVTSPSGAVSTYTWPTPATITRNDVGDFTGQFIGDAPGVWVYRWVAAGAVVGEEERRVIVRVSATA